MQRDRPRDELIWLQGLRKEYGEAVALPCKKKSKKRNIIKTTELNGKIKESQSYEDKEKETELENTVLKEQTVDTNPETVRQTPQMNKPLPECSGGDPGERGQTPRENRPKK